MINLDPYIVDFVAKNWIALSILLGALKIVAKMTDWVGDDAIYTLLSGLFGQIRGKPPPEQSTRERGELLD